MDQNISPLIPAFVRESYEISQDDEVTRLSGGQVNETLLVQQEHRKFILRRLAPALGAHTVHNTHVVSDHLSGHGWEAPIIEPTPEGRLHVSDDSGAVWHAMSHITSDNQQPMGYSPDLASSAGWLLGNWHASVRSLEYIPQSLPYFHDINYIAAKLQSDSTYLDTKSGDLAQLFLNDYANQGEPLESEQQIIHGDPKLDNMLYRNQRPFTLIDFDCVMRDTVWTDVGDFIRSISGKLLSAGQYTPEVIHSFSESYREASSLVLSADESMYNTLQAARRISCELGMRYLSDIVNGENYFMWDNSLYDSRAEALYDKAWLQYQVVTVLRNQLNEKDISACVE